MKAAQLKVMLVEDDDRDAQLTIRAFRRQPEVAISRVETGEEALERLAVPELRPDLILLDLSLPGVDGHAVLAAAKVDQELRKIPVVVLTSSRSDEDVLRSWIGGVAGYLPKPIDLAQFRRLALVLSDWWCFNELPPR